MPRISTLETQLSQEFFRSSSLHNWSTRSELQLSFGDLGFRHRIILFLSLIRIFLLSLWVFFFFFLLFPFPFPFPIFHLRFLLPCVLTVFDLARVCVSPDLVITDRYLQFCNLICDFPFSVWSSPITWERETSLSSLALSDSFCFHSCLNWEFPKGLTNLWLFLPSADMETEVRNQNQRGCKALEPEVFLQWGKRKRLRCPRNKDPEISERLCGSLRKKIGSRSDRCVISASEKERIPLQPNRLTRSEIDVPFPIMLYS